MKTFVKFESDVKIMEFQNKVHGGKVQSEKLQGWANTYNLEEVKKFIYSKNYSYQ